MKQPATNEECISGRDGNVAPLTQMRASHPDESKLMFLPLLHLDSVDLRGLPAIRA